MSTPIANLINQLLVSTGLRHQKDLAQLINDRIGINIPAPRFSDWKRGERNPTMPQAMALVDFAQMYGIDADPMALANVAPLRRSHSPGGEPRLPMLGVSYAQQNVVDVVPWPVPVLDQPGGYCPVGCVWFGDKFLSTNDIDPSQAAVMWIHDDSMRQTLPCGSAFMVDRRQKDLKENSIFAVSHSGELLVRRAMQQGSSWLLVADSAHLSVLPVALGTQVIGRVVWTSRLL